MEFWKLDILSFIYGVLFAFFAMIAIASKNNFDE